jgi:hypothetical protein
MDPEDRRAFAALRQSELKTARAWALKTAMGLYNYVYEGQRGSTSVVQLGGAQPSGADEGSGRQSTKRTCIPCEAQGTRWCSGREVFEALPPLRQHYSDPAGSTQ